MMYANHESSLKIERIKATRKISMLLQMLNVLPSKYVDFGYEEPVAISVIGLKAAKEYVERMFPHGMDKKTSK
jgi:hypothetical protein